MMQNQRANTAQECRRLNGRRTVPSAHTLLCRRSHGENGFSFPEATARNHASRQVGVHLERQVMFGAKHALHNRQILVGGSFGFVNPQLLCQTKDPSGSQVKVE